MEQNLLERAGSQTTPLVEKNPIAALAYLHATEVRGLSRAFQECRRKDVRRVLEQELERDKRAILSRDLRADLSPESPVYKWFEEALDQRVLSILTMFDDCFRAWVAKDAKNAILGKPTQAEIESWGRRSSQKKTEWVEELDDA